MYPKVAPLHLPLPFTKLRIECVQRQILILDSLEMRSTITGSFAVAS